MAQFRQDPRAESPLSDLKKGKVAGTVEFIAVQKMRLTPQSAADPDGPEQRFLVTCDLRAEVCRERIQD
jgi:hypothetical protein